MEMKRLKEIFLYPAKPLIKKRDIHWGRIIGGIGLILTLLIAGVLVMPVTPEVDPNFRERLPRGQIEQEQQKRQMGKDPTSETLAQMQLSPVAPRPVPQSIQDLYRPSSSASGGQGPPGGSGGGRSSTGDQNASMLIARAGTDTKNALQPGATLNVRIVERVVIAGGSMPVTGLLTSDVLHENSVAIPQGAKLIGSASFDSSSDRAKVTWTAVITPDGRQRPIQATGVSSDGRPGLIGKVHSNAAQTTAGIALAKFIGAYAEGSMSQGAFGANTGGSENGLKNAISETAQDRAGAWAQDLTQEERWIEIEGGQVTSAVLNQAFIFRDPGATYGG